MDKVVAAGTEPAYAALAAAIREQILSGKLRPGDRLPTEPEVSANYQVSRSTAREALRILSSQGLVETRRGATGGNFVAHPPATMLTDGMTTGLRLMSQARAFTATQLMDVRDMFEIPAAEAAALHRTDEDLAALEASLFGPGELGADEIFTRNRGFHVGILRATQNPLLEIIATPIFSVLEVRRANTRSTWDDVQHEHREILHWIREGDPIRAREACRDHLRSLRKHYLRVEAERAASGG